MQEDDPNIGRSYGGYETQSKIGAGAMGTVYRAVRGSDRQPGFVVKVLDPFGADRVALERFRREIDVMSAIQHPNVVRVFASGEEEGCPYMVMELVDGPSLKDLLDRHERFDWSRAAKSARQIALALEAAHAMGVIHRDVKPENILFSKSEGLLKVADFGVAKVQKTAPGSIRPRSDPRLTMPGDIVGSPSYMAPEQWGDHDVDQRADLFALGVVLYQLVTGVPPFLGKTRFECGMKIQAGEYVAVEKRTPDIAPGVRDIIVGLLEHDRANRYHSAAQVAADLERVLKGETPDVPRLEGGGARHALLGKHHFLVGRADKADIKIVHPSVEERHVELERTSVGLLMRGLDGKGKIRVNDMRVTRDVVLKDGDVLQLGDAEKLRFRMGALAPVLLAKPSSPGSDIAADVSTVFKLGAIAAPPVPAPAPVYSVLLRDASPMAVLASIELLDERTRSRNTLRSRARLLAAGVDPQVVEVAVEHAQAAYERFAKSLPDRLLKATRENLGADVETWLGWWLGGGHARLPVQVQPPGPRPTGVVTLVAPGKSDVEEVALDVDHETWPIGRDDVCPIKFADLSVSRRHATISRLLTRFAVKDDGSRHGVALGGKRRTVALLADRDTVDVGRAKVLFREAEDGGGTRGVDELVFDALVELRSLHVAEALVAFTDRTKMREWVARSRWTPPPGPDPRIAVNNLIDEKRRLALAVLPEIAGASYGEDPAAWREWAAGMWDQLPAQVTPEGWETCVDQR